MAEEVKIDTKEKFVVLHVTTPAMYDNLSAKLFELAHNQLQLVPKNVIINFTQVATAHTDHFKPLIELQQTFYEHNASLVFCGLRETIENELEQAELLEIMNTTPTESEAWDIVQMEEIERELLDDEEPLFQGFDPEN
ncbi:MAG: STAS domain-containing protein [Bacteroidetes bacterium]|nr:MAG: STAS domain-containing protein [Bacteroidota bacterium]TAE69509.1 MAG: STAS domain-containing protein [Bacteroidota bacterium]TAF91663.1 MAG: STAS domain-containing protein [Bacteroidota bacterium]